MATTPLPPRLSEQQQYLLAALADTNGKLGYNALRERYTQEFDDDGDLVEWITDGERADDLEAEIARRERVGLTPEWMLARRREEAATLRETPNNRTVAGYTDTCLASLSRSLRRLDDRGLVDRIVLYGWNRKRRTKQNIHEWRPRDRSYVSAVQLTDEGREAGREILRRHSDGRYSLSFDTLD